MMRSLVCFIFLLATGVCTFGLGQTVPRPVSQPGRQPTRQQQTPTRRSQGPVRRAQPRAANQRNAVPVSQQQGGALAPEWIPLQPPHEQRLAQILEFWEHSTQRINRYRCKFRRYDYGAQAVKSYSEGVIKFSKPDKGLFRVEKMKTARVAKPGEKPQWVDQEQSFFEHWVCDGRTIFEFDHHRKQIVQRPLPPDLQGQRITEGPLPFMFGAKADQIRQRFWIRPFWPENAGDVHWLELIPKTRQDAANYRQLHIVIAQQDFLPKGMILFYRDGTRTNFVFDDRETNWNIVPQQLNLFHREFFEPRTPRGWTKVVAPSPDAPAAAPQSVTRQPDRRAPNVRKR